MADKVIHISHCTYVNDNIEYEWNKEVGSDYHTLANLYAITLVKKSGSSRKSLATVIVKTNLGQTHSETGSIFAAMRDSLQLLRSLPSENITLISTKIKTPLNYIPTEEKLLDIMTDMYIQNSAGGSS